MLAELIAKKKQEAIETHCRVYGNGPVNGMVPCVVLHYDSQYGPYIYFRYTPVGTKPGDLHILPHPCAPVEARVVWVWSDDEQKGDSDETEMGESSNSGSIRCG